MVWLKQCTSSSPVATYSSSLLYSQTDRQTDRQTNTHTHTHTHTRRQTKALFYSTILIAVPAASKFPALHEPEGSCLFSEQPNTGPSSELDNFIPHSDTIFLIFGTGTVQAVYHVGYGMYNRVVMTQFLVGTETLTFPTAFKLNMGSTQPLTQWILGTLIPLG